jgi:hypothetical protein
MTGTPNALVGPLRRITYYPGWGRVTLYTATPDNDRDPAAWNCLDHHPACACREGHFGTLLREHRDDMRAYAYAEKAAREVFRWLLDKHRPCHPYGRAGGLTDGCLPGGGLHVGTPRCLECGEHWPCETATRAAQAWRETGPFGLDAGLVAHVLDPANWPDPRDIEIPF